MSTLYKIMKWSVTETELLQCNQQHVLHCITVLSAIKAENPCYGAKLDDSTKKGANLL